MRTKGEQAWSLVVAAVVAVLVAVSTERLESVPPALREYRARHTVFAYDVVGGGLRALTAIDDVPEARVPCAIHLRTEGTERTTDARAQLRAGEYLIADGPIRDEHDGRLLSVSPDAYSSIEGLRRMPLDTLELFAVTLADLVYVTNGEALAQVLAQRGIEIVEVGGVLRDRAPEAEAGVPTFLLAVHPTFGPVLALRGTGDLADVQRDLDAVPVPSPRGGRVHAGFHAGVEDVLGRTRARLGELYRRHGRMTVTGHSLGAGLATLVHVELVDELPGLRTFAFAPPPVGDLRFVEGQKGRIAGLDAYFLPGEELEHLALAGSLLDADALHWLGRRDVLPSVPIARGASHYLVNYERALLARMGASERWLRALPACLVTDLPCFDHVDGRARGCPRGG